MIRNWKLSVALVAALLLPAPLVKAQQSSTDDLRKEIQALSEAVKAMQKDLQEIKAMLQSRMPTPPPQVVSLDLEGMPEQGERTAKLTLVEFSDYQ